jgi:hypothetical protein
MTAKQRRQRGTWLWLLEVQSISHSYINKEHGSDRWKFSPPHIYTSARNMALTAGSSVHLTFIHQQGTWLWLLEVQSTSHSYISKEHDSDRWKFSPPHIHTSARTMALTPGSSVQLTFIHQQGTWLWPLEVQSTTSHSYISKEHGSDSWKFSPPHIYTSARNLALSPGSSVHLTFMHQERTWLWLMEVQSTSHLYIRNEHGSDSWKFSPPHIHKSARNMNYELNSPSYFDPEHATNFQNIQINSNAYKHIGMWEQTGQTTLI